jgi:hypothetical protein
MLREQSLQLHRSGLSAMCELEHDAAKGRFEIHRDCSVERPLPRRRLHRSMNIAGTARKCCVSNSRGGTSPVCPAQRRFSQINAARCTNSRFDGPDRSILRWIERQQWAVHTDRHQGWKPDFRCGREIERAARRCSAGEAVSRRLPPRKPTGRGFHRYDSNAFSRRLILDRNLQIGRNRNQNIT